MPLISRPRCSQGFSMLEVLLALVVLSVGLLGASVMLLESLRTHGGALRRIGATQLARDMADRIRANPSARALYDSRGAPPGGVDCATSGGCDATERAALGRTHFTEAARALFAPH